MENKWSITEIWNETLLIQQGERKYEPRDIIWASEIGSPFIDRWLKMNATPVTNPYLPRTLRIFEAGHLFEWIVERVLRKTGLLIDTQQKAYFRPEDYPPEYGNLLGVWGRYDIEAGGKPDYQKALEFIKNDKLPSLLESIAIKIIEKFQTIYPDGLENLILEVKSVNSLAFWAHLEELMQAYKHHRMQLYTYMRYFKKDGKIIYISKDDLTIQEVNLSWQDNELANLWQDDITKMTYYHKENVQPPKEPNIVFNERKQEWEINKWKVGRSQFLTLLTGYKTPEEWEEVVQKEVRKKNRELKCDEELKYFRKKYKDEFRKTKKEIEETENTESE